MRTEEDYPEIKEPTKDYHDFDGWAVKVDDKLSVISTTGECPFSSDTTLYGTYSPCEYDITYETDGHGTTPTKTSYFYGESYTPSSLTEYGYEFKGWTPEGITPTTHGDVNFVASWEFVKRYTVTFDTDGGSEVEPKTVISGETIGELPQTTKEDYTFMGWVDDKQLNVTPAYVVTADITIHAKYIQNPIILERMNSPAIESEGKQVYVLNGTSKQYLIGNTDVFLPVGSELVIRAMKTTTSTTENQLFSVEGAYIDQVEIAVINNKFAIETRQADGTVITKTSDTTCQANKWYYFRIVRTSDT
jgi:hypothetical protein